MATRNDVTGDNITTKSSSDAYRSNWERIFGKKKDSDEKQTPKKEDEEE